MRYSKGIMWLDDCRIPFVDEGDIPNDMDKTHLDGRNFYTQVYNGFMYNQNTQGRFTPNLLVCDDMLNDGVISKSGIRKPTGKKPGDYSDLTYSKNMGDPDTIRGFNDKGSNSRYYDLDKWFDKIIDEIR